MAYPTEEGVSAHAGASSHREVGRPIQPIERIQRKDLDGVITPGERPSAGSDWLSQGVQVRPEAVRGQR
jgi:hypothetical protein